MTKSFVEVHILDTTTGKKGALYIYEANFEADGSFADHFWWTDGNMGCDCNRGLVSKVWRWDDAKCGESRFVVEKIVNRETGATVFTDPRLNAKT